MNHARAFGLAAGAALGVGLFLAGRRRARTVTPSSSKSKGKPMRDRLLSVILEALPNPDSVIGPGDALFDQLLGGKVGEGRWKRFERGHGTTCGVAMVGFGELASLTPELLNSAAPGGSGFTPGAHFSRFHAGAQALGWVRRPRSGELPDLGPGDIYVSNKPAKNGVDGGHIGAIVSAQREGDALEIETADGGQDEGIKIRRRRRTVRVSDGSLKYWDGSSVPSGVVAIITPGVGVTRLEWWIRLEGGEFA